MRYRLTALFGVLLGLPAVAAAEFVKIEPAAARLAERTAALLEGKTAAVAARLTAKSRVTWAVDEAVAVELTAALRARGVDAVPAAAHPATESLGEGSSPFTAADARRLKAAGRDALVAVTVSAGSPPQVRVTVWRPDGQAPSGQAETDLPPESLGLDANVPEPNRKVVEFCRSRLGTCVGDGICATLAGEALKAAGAERSGVYTWGRELFAGEPVLPGDVLQLELVALKAPKFSRNFEHHTAVVEEVRPDAVVVLHQNAEPKGKVVQRDVWPVSAARTGVIQAYRPWHGESLLPPVSPRRQEPPKVARHGSSIDLLKTLDPRLDSVKGIWFRDGGLKWNRDTYARLQVPVAPPERYTLHLRARRLFGDDQLGIGLIVGGRQTLLSIDAYGGTKTGLHLLDGKKSRDNESTHTGQVLPPNTLVDLTVRVRPDSVRLLADGKTIVDWSGDAARLSMDPLYAVPRKDWLFLASWNTQCEVTEFTLDED